MVNLFAAEEARAEALACALRSASATGSPCATPAATSLLYVTAGGGDEPALARALASGASVCVRRVGDGAGVAFAQHAGGRAFDAAFLPHVLLAVDDIHSLLVRVRACLRPGGVVVLTAPNPRSLCAFTRGPRWRFAERCAAREPFTLDALVQIVTQAGLTVVEATTSCGEHPRADALAAIASLRPQASAALLSELLARLEAENAGEELRIVARREAAAVSGSGRLCALSVPKGGTWLLARALELVTGKRSPLDRLVQSGAIQERDRTLWDVPQPVFERAITALQQDEYLIGHVNWRPDFERTLAAHDFRAVFVVRDPRDRTVSLAHWIKKHPAVWPHLQDLPFDELLHLLIDPAGRPLITVPPSGDADADRRNAIRGVADVYAEYLPWADAPCVLTVRFEDLVGPKGGGSAAAQSEALARIARHVGVDLAPARLAAIGADVFGGATTGHGSFRSGQIGSWREAFAPEHVAAFERAAAPLLLQLGYAS